MMRVTTNGTLRMYKSNLMQTTGSLNSAMTKLMTQRNFNSYASSPAAATRAFKIHSSLNATRVQASNNETVKNKFDTAYQVLDIVGSDIADSMAKIPALEGLNGPNETNVNELGKVLRSGAESIVQSMNSQYDSKFLFGGADTENPPFAIEKDEVTGKSHITFRGVRIDDPDTLDDTYYADPDKQMGAIMIDDPDVPGGQRPMTNEEVLNMWNEETQFVDIGLGFKLDDDGNVVDSTAFDSALSGIDFIGYGMDDENYPNNMASLMLRMAEIFEGYDTEANEWANPGDYEEAEKLLNKMNDSRDHIIQKWSALSAESTFLNTNATQLETTFASLNTERSTIEDIDMVDTITELSWAQVCYSAALQVGTSVIPQSLMDYLK